MRIGSLFSGVGGLDMAVEQAFGAETAWHCEIDKAASKVLAARWPGVPNFGDITQIEWWPLAPVDILCGGYPCQPFSAAGQRKGSNDERHLWPYFAEAIRVLRPRYVVLENVAGHRSMGFDRVLADLAGIGYVGSWCSLRASDVGAPHRRERLFVLATDTTIQLTPQFTESDGGQRPRFGAGVRAGHRDSAGDSSARVQQLGRTTRKQVADAPHSACVGRHEGRAEPARLERGFDAAVSGDGPLLPTPRALDATGVRGRTPNRSDAANARAGLTLSDVVSGDGPVDLLPTPNASDASGGGAHPDKRVGHSRQLIDYVLLCTPSASDGAGGKTSRSGGRIDEPLLGGQAREMSANWGKYAAAIHRWESLTRPAPSPTEPNKNGNPRLSAAFAEWMMGWPAGWVTDIDISRNDQLRIIGNGVVPQQATAALQWLLNISEVAA